MVTTLLNTRADPQAHSRGHSWGTGLEGEMWLRCLLCGWAVPGVSLASHSLREVVFVPFF